VFEWTGLCLCGWGCVCVELVLFVCIGFCLFELGCLCVWIGLCLCKLSCVCVDNVTVCLK
jgi:hypothetical protein